MEITRDLVIKIFDKNKWVYNLDPYYINILAIRGYDISGFNDNKDNIFNDTLCIFGNDFYTNGLFQMYKCTTDPGEYYYEHLLNPKGVAILCPGQYVGAYCLGIHNNKYEALVQRLRPVNVYRRKNKTDINYKKVVYTGMYGINLHKGIDESDLVGSASAGCISFYDIEDFEIFMSLCRKHKSVYGNKFNLTLMEKDNYEL